MAFQPPQRFVPARHSTTSHQRHSLSLDPAPEAPVSSVPQEWVLFSSDRPLESLTINPRPKTNDESTLSDIGSFNSAAVSRQTLGQDSQESSDPDEFTGYLDSLDDGLHDFEESPIQHDSRNLQSNLDTVLPKHDGLGLFPGSNSAVQAQIWQHEQQNPRRIQKASRVPNLHLDNKQFDQELGTISKLERFQMIENWRKEQSQRVFGDTFRTTTRRKRARRSSERISSCAIPHKTKVESGVANESCPKNSALPDDGYKTILERFTQRIVSDVIGLDDVTLYLIFGEPLPADVPVALHYGVKDDEGAVPAQSAFLPPPWPTTILSHIVKELSALLQCLSHKASSATPQNSAGKAIPYAGLPISAKFNFEASIQPSFRFHALQPENQSRIGAEHVFSTNFPRNSDPDAAATHRGCITRSFVSQKTRNLAHESCVGDVKNSNGLGTGEAHDDRHYWEQDLNVRLLFSFLRNRMSSRTSSRVPMEQKPKHSDNASASFRRAAMVRHLHPLIGSSKASAYQSPEQNLVGTVPGPPIASILGRRQSFLDSHEHFAQSCASQSSKKSKTVHSGSGESSRNYWDFGVLETCSNWGQV